MGMYLTLFTTYIGYISESGEEEKFSLTSLDNRGFVAGAHRQNFKDTGGGPQ